MRGRLLSLALVAIPGLLATPIPAAADPTTCPGNDAVCIDESVEGANPTVTSTSPLFVSAMVVPLGNPESWSISVTMLGTLISPGSPSGFVLYEPGSGNLSDDIGITDYSTGGGLSNFTYELFSDDENGHLFGHPCQFTSGGCGTEVEDGTFQLAAVSQATSSGIFTTFLKSDLDPSPVPEPASLTLLGTALLGFGVMRRRRKYV